MNEVFFSPQICFREFFTGLTASSIMPIFYLGENNCIAPEVVEE